MRIYGATHKRTVEVAQKNSSLTFMTNERRRERVSRVVIVSRCVGGPMGETNDEKFRNHAGIRSSTHIMTAPAVVVNKKSPTPLKSNEERWYNGKGMECMCAVGFNESRYPLNESRDGNNIPFIYTYTIYICVLYTYTQWYVRLYISIHITSISVYMNALRVANFLGACFVFIYRKERTATFLNGTSPLASTPRPSSQDTSICQQPKSTFPWYVGFCVICLNHINFISLRCKEL